MTNTRGVTGITFNDDPSGALGEGGGTTGYDLNTGCGSSSAYIYMHVATTTGGNVVTLSSGSGNVQLRNGHILTGTGGADTQVTITDGATVTLSGVNITAIPDDEDHVWPGIWCVGNAVIVLDEGTTNTVKGGGNRSGIYVPANKTLTIQGSGTLNVTGGESAAGIGSDLNSFCGNITIGGGTVTATGGYGAAGIGSGYDQSYCDGISISHDVTRVTATKGNYPYGNAIGAGAYSSCGTVTIGNVETGSIAQSSFTTFPYNVAFNANGGTGYWANSEPFMYNVAQPLWENVLTCTGYTWDGWATTPNGPKVYDDMQVVSNLAGTSGATVTLYARWIAPKAIAGYGTGSGGWKLIASPFTQAVTPTANNGFLTGAYDLYRFDQAATDGLEWRNYKATPFDLESGRGYLYASQAGSTLTFNGTPYSGNGQVTLTKTANAEFECWNLIGNPFGTAKTLGSKPFYRMNDLGTDIIAATNSTIAAMEGIFVVANTNGEIVTFAAPSRGGESEERIVINLCNGAAVIDRAIVRLGEGETLPKLQIHDGKTKIYLPQDGKEYAVVNAGGVGEIPLNFKAAENGTYTLSISSPLTSNLSPLTFQFLHLIDNLTGADVDLLQTPSYTFEGRVSDYASRFRLVFNADEDNLDNTDNFAFVSDGNIVIAAEDAFNASLQVVDTTGSIIVCRDAIHCVSTAEMAPGVYVLRLIDWEKVRTQKIIVR